MSNLEAAPAEVTCGASHSVGAEVLRPREVPLGGPEGDPGTAHAPATATLVWSVRGVSSTTTGPVSAHMDVPPHPHTGLQTVSWLFRSGEVGAPRQLRGACGRAARRAESDDRGRGHLSAPKCRSSRTRLCTVCSCG